MGEDHHGQGERKKNGLYEWFFGEEKNCLNVSGGQL